MTAKDAPTDVPLVYDGVPIIEVSAEEGRRLFDEAARDKMGISGEEFIRRWRAGDYADLVESVDNRHIVDLYLMIPFAEQEP